MKPEAIGGIVVGVLGAAWDIWRSRHVLRPMEPDERKVAVSRIIAARLADEQEQNAAANAAAKKAEGK